MPNDWQTYLRTFCFGYSSPAKNTITHHHYYSKKVKSFQSTKCCQRSICMSNEGIQVHSQKPKPLEKIEANLKSNFVCVQLRFRWWDACLTDFFGSSKKGNFYKILRKSMSPEETAVGFVSCLWRAEEKFCWIPWPRKFGQDLHANWNVHCPGKIPSSWSFCWLKTPDPCRWYMPPKSSEETLSTQIRIRTRPHQHSISTKVKCEKEEF